jgi:hypothetical protein
MGWIICLAAFVACIWTKDIDMFHASGLFAIAGAIETLATKFSRKK